MPALNWDDPIHYAIGKYSIAIIQPAQIAEHDLQGQLLANWLAANHYVCGYKPDGAMVVTTVQNARYLNQPHISKEPITPTTDDQAKILELRRVLKIAAATLSMHRCCVESHHPRQLDAVDNMTYAFLKYSEGAETDAERAVIGTLDPTGKF